MAPLLIALVMVCALGIAWHMARGFWSKSRSAQRHHQVLETLADITQSNWQGPPDESDGADHQAHVRLLGPSGTAPGESALPPPKPLLPTQHAGQSPLRRPARSAHSGGSGQTVAAEPAQSRRRGARPSAVAPPIIPPTRPIGEDDFPEDATRVIPGLTPPPPRAGDEPTRPVPVIRPHVFYFDDLSRRTGPAGAGRRAPAGTGQGPPDGPTQRPAAAVPGPAHPGDLLPPAPGLEGPGRGGTGRGGPGTSRQRRLAAEALVAAAVALIVAGGAVYVALSGRGHPSGQASPPRASRHGGSTPISKTHALHVTTTPTAPTTTLPTTTSTASTTTTPAAPRPAVLLQAVPGADTYRLTSRSASIVVKANGPCWVEVRAGGPSGQVTTEATLQRGGEAKVTGPAWIRLGDPPYAAVTVNGTPYHVPGSKAGVPLNLVFTLS